MLRFGRRALPAAVLEVALDPAERRLAWSLLVEGGAVIATDLGLRWAGAERLDWPDVERVSWQRPGLTVFGIAPVEGAGRRLRFELVDGGDLPEVVRSSVTASIGWSAHYRLRPDGGCRLVGRRRPGRELLDWQVVYDRGTDPGDPALVAQVEVLLDGARRTIG